MINGNSVILQLGKETTYGTKATGTEQIKISSESFKPVYNKIDEGLATGGRGSGLKATMGIGVEFSFATLMRPGFGNILKGALGVETVTGNVHKFTAIESAEDKHLPAWTFYVDRKVGKFAYTGCKIGSLTLTASAGNYLSLDVSGNGKLEEAVSSLASLSSSGLRAFKFAQAKVYKQAKNDEARTELADVTNISIAINNNLDAQVQTTSTGDFYKEPEVGTRDISATVDMIYSAGAETVRNAFYKSDDTLSIEAEFISDETFGEDDTPYSLKIKLPCVQCSDASANMGGLETLSQNMTFNVVDNLTDELIEIELTNEEEGEY